MPLSAMRTKLAAMCLWAVLGMPGCSAPAADNLYADLGGEPGIARIVGETLAISVADTRIAQDFDNINLKWLRQRVVLQICELTGGPCRYPGRDMYAAHRGLHLATLDFNAFTEDLQIAMDREGVPFWTQNRLLAILAPMYRGIVTR